VGSPEPPLSRPRPFHLARERGGRPRKAGGSLAHSTEPCSPRAPTLPLLELNHLSDALFTFSVRSEMGEKIPNWCGDGRHFQSCLDFRFPNTRKEDT
jgi:hypothetical protein